MKRSYTFYIRLAALTLCGALMVSVTTGCCFCLPASVKDKININLPIGTQTIKHFKKIGEGYRRTLRTGNFTPSLRGH